MIFHRTCYLGLSLFAFVLWSCPSCLQSEKGSSTGSYSTSVQSTPASGGVTVQDGKDTQANKDFELAAPMEKDPKKIIKEAEIRFRTDSYAQCRPAIAKAIEIHQAIVVSEDESRTLYGLSNDMFIRVEASRFDSLVEALIQPGTNLEEKKITARDVTEEYVDIEARLKTKREVEQTYLNILRKATNIPDTLAVEKELGLIREQIEATEGKLRYLSDRVNYSTIHLVIHQELDFQGKGFFGKLGDALSGGWEAFLMFLVGLTYLWPLWVIVLVGLFVLFTILRKRRRAKKA